MGGHAVNDRAAGERERAPEPARIPWGPTSPVWGAVQTAGVLATVGLISGLIWKPEPALNMLWNVVIPLVPASLLISPMLWRNSCPLATLNHVSSGRLAELSKDNLIRCNYPA